jgi:hypothetical protein
VASNARFLPRTAVIGIVAATQDDLAPIVKPKNGQQLR